MSWLIDLHENLRDRELIYLQMCWMSPQHCTWLRNLGLTRIKKLVPQHGNTLTRSCVADCAGKSQWAVIMSRGSKYTKQVIEVDFQYPSEGIHYHWDRGEICHGLRSAL